MKKAQPVTNDQELESCESVRQELSRKMGILAGPGNHRSTEAKALAADAKVQELSARSRAMRAEAERFLGPR